MKVFVTGANGFLGSHLVDRLLEGGVEVHILVRKTSNLKWLLGKKVHYHYGDVGQKTPFGNRFLDGLQHTDLVFHVAGVVRAKDPKTYYEVNAQGTARLLEACLEACPKVKRVVVVTSLAAHGPNLDDSPATEDDECHPITDYGKSKRDAELITLRFSGRLPVTIIRPPAIYGPRDNQVFHFFQMVKRGFALLPGWGGRLVNLAYVQDVVNGLLLASENPHAVGEIFFVGENRNYDWEEVADSMGRALLKSHLIKIRVPKALVMGVGAVAELITAVTGRVLPFNLAYARNFTQANWAMDISKAKRLLGYDSQFPLSRGVEETAGWYQKEGWL